MKRISRIRLMLLLLTLPATRIFGLTPDDRRFPRDPKVEVNPEYTALFESTYEASRADFLVKAATLSATFPKAQSLSIPVPTGLGTPLYVDLLYIPASASLHNLLVISCGVHGVEGFAGSAIQRMVMTRYLTPENLTNTGVLLIHAMNPYGFKYIRRVSENNVDLNRNCSASPDLFATKNDGYSKLYSFINPHKPAALGSLSNIFFVERSIAKILKASMSVLRQAVLQGQYQYPEGLYFGGKDFEPQVKAIKPILVDFARDYDRIYHIDLHTGYGERAKMHLFPNPAKNPEVRTGTEYLFSGYRIDWGDSKDFYTISGDFSDLIGELLPDKLVIPMTLEYGTMNSQKTMGSLHSIQNMILENQGFHYGYRNKRSERKIKGWIREMYAPSSPAWQTLVMNQSVGIFRQVFEKLK
jgi:hypothetical protein